MEIKRSNTIGALLNRKSEIVHPDNLTHSEVEPKDHEGIDINEGENDSEENEDQKDEASYHSPDQSGVMFKNAKRKRRSKNDFEGRSFKCPDCGKSYLSMPALNNHRKTKHEYGKYGEKKGRGRPRKEHLILSSTDEARPLNTNNINQDANRNLYKIENQYKHFFEKENRHQIPNEKIDNEFIRKLFNFIFEHYKYDFYISKEEKKNLNYERYGFFNYLLNNWELANQSEMLNNHEKSNEETEKEPEKPVQTIDKVILIYLKECSGKANKEFFEILTKFGILLREGINTINQDKEYCSKNTSEEIPKMLNNIIEEFFQPNFFFGIEISELIDLIAHFSFWLYTNNFSTLKVTY